MLFEKMTLLFSGVSVLRVRVQPDVAGAAAGDARLLPRHHPPHLPQVVLETKVIRMFPKFSQSRRRPLLGPSPG